MEKSIIVALAELRQVTTENIQRSNLPLSIVLSLLEGICNDLRPIAKQQEEDEIKKWNAYIESKKSEDTECQNT